jgi:hypothetical protein
VAFSSSALRPGGWIEFQELNALPKCDDDTMPESDPVAHIYELAGKAFTKFGCDVLLPSKLEGLLREAGFENIHCQVKKVPIGVWAKDKTMRLIGMYQRTAVQEILPSLAGRPFEALGLSNAESQIRVALARKGLGDSTVHRYFDYYFWYAQKPLGAKSEGEGAGTTATSGW